MQPLTRADALYFAVTVFSTVGFGDITPESEAARVVLIVQMLGDLATHSGDIPELPAGGGAIDVEGTAFLTLSGSKVSEVRTVFDTLALAVRTGAVEAPAWWPGRN